MACSERCAVAQPVKEVMCKQLRTDRRADGLVEHPPPLPPPLLLPVTLTRWMSMLAPYHSLSAGG